MGYKFLIIAFLFTLLKIRFCIFWGSFSKKSNFLHFAFQMAIILLLVADRIR